jgi:SAM-dependent methyltransferase
MKLAVRQCPIDRRQLPQRAVSAAARPLKRYLSEQAAHPRGIGGRLIGRLWITETAAVNDAAIDLLAPAHGEHILEIGFGPGRALGLISSRGATATGIDVSEAMVALAGQRNPDPVRTGALTLSVSDGVTIPFKTTQSTPSRPYTTSTSRPSPAPRSKRSPGYFDPEAGSSWSSAVASTRYLGASTPRSTDP